MTRARDLAAFVSNADGDIKFDTDTLFIDSSANKVGIGTTTPDTILELKGADPILTIRDSATSSGAANATLRLAETGASDTLDQYFDIKANNGQLEFIDNWNEGGGTGTRVIIDDSGNVGIGMTPSQLLDLDASSGLSVRFYNSGSFKAGIQVATSSGNMIGTSVADDLAIRSQSDILFSSGGNTERLRVTDNGLTFNGDTAAANALNDYEEGTWTPTYTSGLTGATASYAKYVKVGALVNIGLYLSNLSGKTSGSLVISGLPFTIRSAGYGSTIFESGTTGDFGLARTQTNSTTLDFYNWNASTLHRETYVGNDLGTHLILNISYHTDS